MPPQFARDPERLARLRREARALAALRKPVPAEVRNRLAAESSTVDLESSYEAGKPEVPELEVKLASSFVPVTPLIVSAPPMV